MSTEVDFSTEALEAIKDVRADSNEISYAICGHIDGNPNKVGLVATGTDPGELVNKMDPAEIFYVLARYESVIDMSTTIKFVFFTWQGDNVSFIKKGRYGVTHGSIAHSFEPFHIEFDTSSTDDFELENVMQKLEEMSGTKSKVLTDNVDSGGKPYQMRGFTQNQLPQRADKKSFGISAMATKGASVDVAPDANEAVAKVRNDADSEMWMVAGYDNGNPAGPIVCVGSGCGGFQELKDCIDVNSSMYGLYRVKYTDENEITTIKFVYIHWIGSNVKPMAKAKFSTHKGVAEGLFRPFHVSIFATELSELDESIIMKEIEKNAIN